MQFKNKTLSCELLRTIKIFRFIFGLEQHAQKFDSFIILTRVENLVFYHVYSYIFLINESSYTTKSFFFEEFFFVNV